MMPCPESSSSRKFGLSLRHHLVKLLLLLSPPATAFTPGHKVRQKIAAQRMDLSALGMQKMRVAYQGQPGAYSEKSTKEWLGDKVTTIGQPDFESCFQAVASMECDYACLPFENSLGGSIHENYDLLLRYNLTICAEHEFHVQHCVLAAEGVKLDDIKYAISHPQALAQCDNYLRGRGITPIQTYDTAGSAKMISKDDLPGPCTPSDTCAIASDLAGLRYGLNCLAKGVEDDDTKFTRFLLLGRKGIAPYLPKSIPAKTSIVFTLPNNTAGALHKALACFSSCDIRCSKMEGKPMSSSLWKYMKFRNRHQINPEAYSIPRFQCCYYLDIILSGPPDHNTENALAQLKEQADYIRVLGSYLQKSRLVGPIAEAVQE